MTSPKRILISGHLDRQAARGFVRGITQYANLYGPWVFIRRLPFYKVPSESGSGGFWKQDYQSALQQMIASSQIDGLVAEMPDLSTVRHIVPPDFPAVIIPTEETVPGYVNVMSDPGRTGIMAAEYFLKLGFKQIAFFGYGPIYWSQQREQGFCRRLRQAGIEPIVVNQTQSGHMISWQDELEWIGKQLQNLPRPLAVWAWNDDLAEVVLEACRILDIVVPDEVSVLGCDNDELICNMCHPPLSSIGINFERAGYEMAELLDRQMAGLALDTNVIYVKPTVVMERQSTEIQAIYDREVAQAIRFIRQNAHKSIQVNDVVERIAVSRTVLYDRFRKVLGRSIHEEIKRTRVESIARALITTQAPIKQIALKLGFESESHLSRYFRDIKGLSPQAFRKQFGAK